MLNKPKQHAAIRIVSIYAVAASLWIIFSDRILASIVTLQEDMLSFSIIKGLLFVLVTSLLLLSLLRREMRVLQYHEDALLEREKLLLASQDALSASQERLEGIIQTTPSGIVILDQDGKITFANQRAEEILGLSWSDMAARVYNDPQWKLFGLDGKPVLDAEMPFMRALSTGQPVFGLEYIIERNNGSRCVLRVNAAPQFSQSGLLVGVVASMDDVTQEMERETALRERNEQYRQQVRRLAALREIDMAINANLDLPVILHILLRETLDLLGADAALISRYRPEKKSFDILAELGFSQPPSRGEQWTLDSLPDEVQAGSDSPWRERGVRYRSEKYSEVISFPLVSKGVIKGLMEIYFQKQDGSLADEISFMEMLAGQALIAIDHYVLYTGLESTNRELTLSYDATLEGWARALELRDRETEGHSRRVTELTLQLAENMGIEGEGLVHVRRGSLLHDIGKLGVPDSILQKPGPLTEEERQAMRLHPIRAYEMLANIQYLRPALDIPYLHHERWDGSGYPVGLSGEQIPLPARIFALVDVWDALLSQRPYRPAWTEEATWAYIFEQSGRHFDPKVVEAFARLMGKL